VPPTSRYQHKLKARCVEVVARVTEVSWAVKFIHRTDSYETISSQDAENAGFVFRIRIGIRIRDSYQAMPSGTA
jgi:hypothetical protein